MNPLESFKLISIEITKVLSFLVVPAVCLFVSACASQQQSQPFNFQTCMETVPTRVEGLKVLSGPRTELSIIRDMVPVSCAAQLHFRRMKAKGHDINAGTALFRARVEYTGEVYTAEVIESDIASPRFLRKTADDIANTDFVGWAADKTDTVFIYPIVFEE